MTTSTVWLTPLFLGSKEPRPNNPEPLFPAYVIGRDVECINVSSRSSTRVLGTSKGVFRAARTGVDDREVDIGDSDVCTTTAGLGGGGLNLTSESSGSISVGLMSRWGLEEGDCDSLVCIDGPGTVCKSFSSSSDFSTPVSVCATVTMGRKASRAVPTSDDQAVCRLSHTRTNTRMKNIRWTRFSMGGLERGCVSTTGEEGDTDVAANLCNDANAGVEKERLGPLLVKLEDGEKRIDLVDQVFTRCKGGSEPVLVVR
jgi:hypothetical protein